MKTLLLLLLCTGATVASRAQKADKLLIRTYYIKHQKGDTLTNGNQRTETMVLFLGKNASLFTSLDKIKHEVSEDQKFRAKIMATTTNKPTAFIIDSTPTAHMSKTDYFYFVKENLLVTKEVIALQSYLISEPAATIPWKITADTLSFSGIKCQKATAKLEDQLWTVWFASSYPFPVGPWKLNGLPGLIIEAYDENRKMYYQFAGIENATVGDIQRTSDVTKKPNADPDTYNPVDQLIGRDVAAAYFEQVIKLPPSAIKTSRPQFEKLLEAFKKDPKGFTRTQGRY